MLPSDFSPEKRMRQRFVKREADMRRGLTEAKMTLSKREPFWTVEVQFSREDEIDVRDEPGSRSFSDWFRRIITAGNFDVTAGSQRRFFIEVRAKSGKEALKIINTFLTQAKKVSGMNESAGKLHEAKVRVSTTSPVWVVEVQFDKEDFVSTQDKPSPTSGMTGFPLEVKFPNSLYDTFMRVVSQSRLEIEERMRERRIFVKVPARSAKDAQKIVNDFLAQANKEKRDDRLKARGRR